MMCQLYPLFLRGFPPRLIQTLHTISSCPIYCGIYIFFSFTVLVFVNVPDCWCLVSANNLNNNHIIMILNYNDISKNKYHFNARTKLKTKKKKKARKCWHIFFYHWIFVFALVHKYWFLWPNNFHLVDDSTISCPAVIDATNWIYRRSSNSRSLIMKRWVFTFTNIIARKWKKEKKTKS